MSIILLLSRSTMKPHLRFTNILELGVRSLLYKPFQILVYVSVTKLNFPFYSFKVKIYIPLFLEPEPIGEKINTV